MINIRQRTVMYVQRNYDISPGVVEAMFDTGLIREDLAKRVLIRDEYNRKAMVRKKTDLKIFLAEKYAVSLSTIEKIVSESVEIFP